MQVENLTVDWEGRRLLRMPFKAHWGEIIAIMGDNGAAKPRSSCPSSPHPATGREDHLRGEDIASLKAHVRARCMGLALQIPTTSSSPAPT